MDTYGLLPGHEVESADAKQAYTQALLRDKTPGSRPGAESGGQVPRKVKTTTWVILPWDVRPKDDKGRDVWTLQGLKDPVVPLIKALCGHADAD